MSDAIPKGWTVPKQEGQRDAAEVCRPLEQWMNSRLSGIDNAHVNDLSWPDGAGVSNETILFSARWREDGRDRAAPLVLRIKPGGFQLFRDSAFDLQYRLLQAIHADASVPVAAPLWYEDDPAYFGQAFFVMARLRGRVPVSYPPYNATGWLFDARPADRARLWENSIAALANIHAIPLETVAFLDKAERGATGFDQLLSLWLESHGWACAGVDYSALTETRDWLLAHLPADRPTGLSWGDSRIGNIMYADDVSIAGVMDWEQASLGGAMQDLGWWTFFDRLHSHSMGLKRLDGLGTQDETIALWQDLTGRRATDLHWHQIFAGYKVALIVARRLSITQKIVPGYNANNNLWTRLIAELRGTTLPADMLQGGAKPC